ncbi:MAG: hypothetical protein U1F67_07145 [Rubrivivax sp.]
MIAHSDIRVLAFLNISFPGIFAFDRRVMLGEAARSCTLLDVARCVEVARANAGTVLGIKVRLGGAVSGEVGLVALERALEAADALGLPVMCPRPAAAGLCRDRREAAARRRHPHALLPPGAQRAGGRQWPHAAGTRAGAPARRALRHRPRHGRVRLRQRRGGHRRGFPARHGVQRRARPERRRPGAVRPAAHDEQALQLRHRPRRPRAHGHRSTG